MAARDCIRHFETIPHTWAGYAADPICTLTPGWTAPETISMKKQPRRAATIAHIGIAVRDLDAILPLYRNILGLEQVPIAAADGARIVALAVDDSLVELRDPSPPSSPLGK